MASFLNKRTWRALAVAATALALATFIEPPQLTPRPAGRAMVTAAEVALNPEDPAQRQVGALTFLRGWHLTSPEHRLGGISAMHVEDGRVVAISDAGVLLHFPLPQRPGVQPLHVQPLPQSAGARKSSFDSEAMLVRGDRVWIAFERRNAVVRYRLGELRLESAASPRLMRGWRGNAGAEGMVRLADDCFLVFSEGRADDSPFSAVALFAGDPAEAGTPAALLRYRRAPGFRVTDAAALADGRLLILSRRFSLFGGVAARLEVADTSALRAGATIEGRLVAELTPPLSVDNMEALSVASEGGRTIVRIASDNNFMALQRTLLLEFALEEEPRR